MKEKISLIAIVLSVISLFISVVAFTHNGNAGTVQDGSFSAPQYVMYVGTNDKDSYKPEHSQEEAKKIVDDICLKYFEGYTLQEATGSWTDEKNNVTHEYTIVCYFDDADLETVHKAADEVIKALNQNTVLIEQDTIQMEYYEGGN